MNKITKRQVFGIMMLIFFFNNLHAEETKVDMVVATVNSQEITLGDVIVAVGKLPKDYDSVDNKYLFSGVLDQLVKQEIMSQRLDPSDLHTRILLEQEVRSIRAKYAVEAIMRGFPTEEQIQAAYQEISSTKSDTEEYNASHILVPSKDEAQEIIDLLANGADFSTLAKDRSTGPSGPNGGKLGWFGTGQMVPEFEAAVMVLEVGNISRPLQTQFGWHVIKLNNLRKKQVPSFEEIRPQIIQDLNQQRVKEIVSDAVSESRVEFNEFEGDFGIIRKLNLIKQD